MSKRRRDQDSLAELLDRGRRVRRELEDTIERIRARRLARQASYSRRPR